MCKRSGLALLAGSRNNSPERYQHWNKIRSVVEGAECTLPRLRVGLVLWQT